MRYKAVLDLCQSSICWIFSSIYWFSNLQQRFSALFQASRRENLKAQLHCFGLGEHAVCVRCFCDRSDNSLIYWYSTGYVSEQFTKIITSSLRDARHRRMLETLFLVTTPSFICYSLAFIFSYKKVNYMRGLFNIYVPLVA